jgi:protocatechuate 3,4-dioxygenase alpha subunit
VNGPTPSQTVGPFFGFALPFESDADAVAPSSPGALRIEGQVLDGAGEPVPDAMIEAWGDGQFARCRTDAEGAFHLTVRKPAAERGHAPALNVFLFARGLLRHLVTRIYFPDETDANRSDPALQLVDPARRQTLIAQDAGGSLHFDVKLQGDEETVFFEI